MVDLEGLAAQMVPSLVSNRRVDLGVPNGISQVMGDGLSTAEGRCWRKLNTMHEILHIGVHSAKEVVVGSGWVPASRGQGGGCWHGHVEGFSTQGRSPDLNPNGSPLTVNGPLLHVVEDTSGEDLRGLFNMVQHGVTTYLRVQANDVAKVRALTSGVGKYVGDEDKQHGEGNRGRDLVGAS
ncbi:hypothetical protein NE237_002182 [Protea cynaroides]|uniref:Uncharacterized protein n=1 Tax=Protea cynaroides TaxID=273540 RepID=A0A9Q0KVK5_9MAGN|nr:hypothetical protein NE237_002182 [Protea cynaroides]